MNKKFIILSAAILLVLSMTLAACQTDASENTTPAPSATQTNPSESPRQTEQTENTGEYIEQPTEQETQLDEEINFGDLLIPGGTGGDTSSKDEETTVDTLTEDTSGQFTESTTQSTEPSKVPEATQPDTTQAPNDGYSNNWY